MVARPVLRTPAVCQKAKIQLEVTKVAAKVLKPHIKRRANGKEGLLFVFFSVFQPCAATHLLNSRTILARTLVVLAC